jgi:DNA polymerase V
MIIRHTYLDTPEPHEQRVSRTSKYEDPRPSTSSTAVQHATGQASGSKSEDALLFRKSQPVFALIDCNNFFVSCVRTFRPDLEGKPVVALSSNDGCVVARSNEAKELGIPMGAPVFKWRQLFQKHNVVQFSGNFELYADISRRVTTLLKSITPHIEIYSVDESFLDLSELDIEDYTAWAKEVRRLVLQWTGMPVAIGIAGSKTLAKLAGDRAKKEPELEGVLDLYSPLPREREPYLQRTPLKDIWGVGWRLAPKLKAEGIHNALDLTRLRPQFAQSLMGIHGRQLIAELKGLSCLPLQKVGKPAKSIANTRTFGEDTNQLNVLEAAVASFAAKTSQRLRASGQLTTKAGIFIATNKHKPGYHMKVEEIRFTAPTADTGQITTAVTEKLQEMFNAHDSYHRAGVWLYDFIPESAFQIDLLGNARPDVHDQSTERMDAIDQLNKRYGKHTVYYAAEDLGNSWQPKRGKQMPRFTTRWEELAPVKVR